MPENIIRPVCVTEVLSYRNKPWDGATVNPSLQKIKAKDKHAASF